MFQPLSKMKKTINKFSLLALLSILYLVASCNSQKDEEVPVLSTHELVQQVDTVMAIGKVSTENTALITSTTTSTIQEVLVQEGDSVKKGDILIRLANKVGNYDVALEKAKLTSLRSQNQITLQDIEREKLHLQHLEEKYLTTKRLFERQAETKENLQADETNFLQQQKRLASLQSQLQVTNAQVKEQQIQINKAATTQTDYTIVASTSGTITDLKAKVGQAINPNESLGEIIDLSQVIIEAEVDELFAQKVAVGQAVQFSNIGTKQTIGEGTIIYTSPTLMNKSILYETANEADDRRVRKIKIKPSTTQHLLINAKVACQIKVQ